MVEENKLKAGLKKRSMSVASALIALSVVPNVVAAQTLATIIVSATVELNFGTFTGGAGGTITVPFGGGARTTTGTVTPIAGAGLETPASLSVSASTGVSVVVSMDALSYNVTGPGAPMAVNGFDINGSGATATVSMTTNPITLPLGATLNVGVTQADGVYTGSYTVNANYL